MVERAGPNHLCARLTLGLNGCLVRVPIEVNGYLSVSFPAGFRVVVALRIQHCTVEADDTFASDDVGSEPGVRGDRFST